jgi:Ala-tRNA(Pro) deacylase
MTNVLIAGEGVTSCFGAGGNRAILALRPQAAVQATAKNGDKPMGIALTLHQYLEGHGVSYEVVTHQRTVRSSATAKASSVPANNLAKGVLIKCKDGFLLAVVPASRHVRLDALGSWLNQTVRLATEAEASRIFADCALGSLPPIAAAYGLTAVMDGSLEGCDDIYFEGGDHSSLVHLSGAGFRQLMAGVPHAAISGRHH